MSLPSARRPPPCADRGGARSPGRRSTCCSRRPTAASSRRSREALETPRRRRSADLAAGASCRGPARSSAARDPALARLAARGRSRRAAGRAERHGFGRLCRAATMPKRRARRDLLEQALHEAGDAEAADRGRTRGTGRAAGRASFATGRGRCRSRKHCRFALRPGRPAADRGDGERPGPGSGGRYRRQPVGAVAGHRAAAGHPDRGSGDAASANGVRRTVAGADRRCRPARNRRDGPARRPLPDHRRRAAHLPAARRLRHPRNHRLARAARAGAVQDRA